MADLLSTILGTTIRASVAYQAAFACSKRHGETPSGRRQVSATGEKCSGEHSEAVGGKYDIFSNGEARADGVRGGGEDVKGVEELIRMEKEAENKDDKKKNEMNNCSIEKINKDIL